MRQYLAFVKHGGIRVDADSFRAAVTPLRRASVWHVRAQQSGSQTAAIPCRPNMLTTSSPVTYFAVVSCDHVHPLFRGFSGSHCLVNRAVASALMTSHFCRRDVLIGSLACIGSLPRSRLQSTRLTVWLMSPAPHTSQD